MCYLCCTRLESLLPPKLVHLVQPNYGPVTSIVPLGSLSPMCLVSRFNFCSRVFLLFGRGKVLTREQQNGAFLNGHTVMRLATTSYNKLLVCQNITSCRVNDSIWTVGMQLEKFRLPSTDAKCAKQLGSHTHTLFTHQYRQHLCMLATCERTETSAHYTSQVDTCNHTDSSSELVVDVALRIRITSVMSQVQVLTEAVPEAIALTHAAKALRLAASILALPITKN